MNMRYAQDRYESVPVEWDDESLSPEEAREIALDEVLRTPYNIAWALHNDMGIDDPVTIDVDALQRPEYEAHGKAAGELLAVLISGNDKSALAARAELRYLLADAMADLIAERAREILDDEGLLS